MGRVSLTRHNWVQHTHARSLDSIDVCWAYFLPSASHYIGPSFIYALQPSSAYSFQVQYTHGKFVEQVWNEFSELTWATSWLHALTVSRLSSLLNAIKYVEQTTFTVCVLYINEQPWTLSPTCTGYWLRYSSSRTTNKRFRPLQR